MSLSGVSTRFQISPLLLAPLAQLSDAEQAKEHYKTGAAHFEWENFEEALNEFRMAYRLSQRPELQYNIARCLEKLQRYEEAIQAYQQYLLGKPGASDRETVQSRISLLLDFLKQAEEAKKKQPAADKTERSLEPTPPPPEPEKPDPIQPIWSEDIYVSQSEAAGRPYRTAQWVSLGLSAAGLGFGLFAHFKVKDKEGEYEERVDGLTERGKILDESGKGPIFASPEAEAENQPPLDDLADDVDKWGTTATVGFIVGGASLGAALLFFGLDQRQISMMPAFQTDGAGVLLRKDF